MSQPPTTAAQIDELMIKYFASYKWVLQVTYAGNSKVEGVSGSCSLLDPFRLQNLKRGRELLMQHGYPAMGHYGQMKHADFQ